MLPVPGPPKVLHYGTQWKVPNTTWSWHKAWYHNAFDAMQCPPWDLAQERPSGGLFPFPPSPAQIPSQACCCRSTPTMLACSVPCMAAWSPD